MSFGPVTEFLDGLEKTLGIPACECVVYRDHMEVYRHCAGHMEQTGGEPLRGGEWYWLYSCTKLATVTAAMQLWERGLLGIDDPVSKYLPEYADINVIENGSIRPAVTAMTVRHLMTMTGGFSYDQTLPSVLEAKRKNASTRELIRMLASEPLRFDPGTRFLYSMCHDVLAAVVETASGERFSDYLEAHIFAPLGVTGVTFRPGSEELERMPSQLTWDENGRCLRDAGRGNSHRLTPGYDSGGAGICCRAEDYILFLDALACSGEGANGARILRPETVSAMTENRLSGQPMRDFCAAMKPSGSEGYALGMRVHLIDDEFPKGEFGWDGAAGALAVMDPGRRVSILYLQHVLKLRPDYAQLTRLIYRALDV